jgi:hypothetical protein
MFVSLHMHVIVARVRRDNVDDPAFVRYYEQRHEK